MIYTQIRKQPAGNHRANATQADPIPCLVFDPFVGSGTTVQVAYNLGRRGVGLDLSMEYLSKQQRPGYTTGMWGGWCENQNLFALQAQITGDQQVFYKGRRKRRARK